jgi:hypothetical protein
MDNEKMSKSYQTISVGRAPYNHTNYLNLLESCRRYGYVKIGRGKPSLDELHKYIYENMNTKEPLSPIEIERSNRSRKVPLKKYNTNYYKTLVYLARKNGFVYKKVGKVSIQTLIDYLTSKRVQLPEETVVMNQKRIKYSQCKNSYSRLLFQAKALGYKHERLTPTGDRIAVLGRDSIIKLLDFITKAITPTGDRLN